MLRHSNRVGKVDGLGEQRGRGLGRNGSRGKPGPLSARDPLGV